MLLSAEISAQVRIPYGLRRVPRKHFATLLNKPELPRRGDIALARLEKIGRNARLELANGRPCTLHEGDLLAVVFGNRYATEQFEGYAQTEGGVCDLLSMGGLCGRMASKHASAADPTRLSLLGLIGDQQGRPLQLLDYALPPITSANTPRVAVVCGTSMDSGKTHTAMSLVRALQRLHQVAFIKLTGTAAGRDTWNLIDAGANPAYDFVDGGFPSTYLCDVEELIGLYRLLVAHAAFNQAAYAVVEIADGLLQVETAALLRDSRFTSTVDGWVFAAGDPMAAVAGVRALRALSIEPLAVSGRLSMSPLGMQEAERETGVQCMTALELQNGRLNDRLGPLLNVPAPSSQAVGEAILESRTA